MRRAGPSFRLRRRIDLPISLSLVAARIHRSGAFITIKANRLVGSGILQKTADPKYGRRVLLRSTGKRIELE